MASSVNPSDRRPSVAPSFERGGHVLGSDVAGVVAEVGGGCSRLRVGDRVWGDIGANTHTATGGKTKELGGYGKYAMGLESQLWAIPANMGFIEAGSLPKVALTSLKALAWYAGARNDTLWKASPTILVLGGSGGTGTTGIQLARAFGGSGARIIATTSAANSDYCRSLGANATIDYRTRNWWDPSVVADNSVDVVYDTVGQAGTGDRAMAKIRPGGYYVTIAGALALRAKAGVRQHMFINSDTNLDSAALLGELAGLAGAGRLRMPAVDGAYTLDQVPQAFARSGAGHVRGKLAIDVGNSGPGAELHA